MGFTSGQMVAVMKGIGTRESSTASGLSLIKEEVDLRQASGRMVSA